MVAFSVSPQKTIATNSPEFWNSWEPIIDRIAGRFRRNRRIDFDDLLQAGRLALVRATTQFDPARGVPLSHYAMRAIRNAIYSEAMRSRRFFDGEVVEPWNCVDPAGSMLASEMTAAISAWRATLSPRLRQVFDLLYVRGLSQRATGAEMGLGQPRIAQVHRELLEDARAYLTSPFDPSLN